MVKLTIALLLLFSVFSQSFSQSEYKTSFPKSYGLILGYQGFQKNLIEIGAAKGLEGSILFGREKAFRRIKKPYATLYGSYHFDPIDNINGAVIGVSMAGVVVYGLDLNYYTYQNDFLGLRTSVGISLFGVEALYRYNFKLIGERTTGISGHQFTVRYYLPIWVNSDDGFKFMKRYRQD